MKNLIILRGGGDIATGVACKLHNCGFPVVILESPLPSAIRRTVAFSEAVYQGSQRVEGILCQLAKTPEEALSLAKDGTVALLVDPEGSAIPLLQPLAVVDAILAKKNLGTHRDMAPITIGLGPGFEAGRDVDAVIETLRGHNLGRVLYEGSAAPNTGTPGLVGGHGPGRVIRSTAAGIFHPLHSITDPVNQGEVVAWVDTGTGRSEITASISGILRGMLRDGHPVTEGFKAGDIDPRGEEKENCFTVSDKARCIAGGVLEAILQMKGR